MLEGARLLVGGDDGFLSSVGGHSSALLFLWVLVVGPVGCWWYSVILEWAVLGKRGVWLPNPLGSVFTERGLRQFVTVGGNGSPMAWGVFYGFLICRVTLGHGCIVRSFKDQSRQLNLLLSFSSFNRILQQKIQLMRLIEVWWIESVHLLGILIHFSHTAQFCNSSFPSTFFYFR